MKQGEDGSWSFAGMCPEIFHVIQSYLNFTYTLGTPTDGQWGGKVSVVGVNKSSHFHLIILFKNDDGTWTGAVGLLHRKENDLSPISFTRTKLRQVKITMDIKS